MPSIKDVIVDYTPANNEVDTPLISTIKILFDRAMDEVALSEQVFIEGPDTDQFVGPGSALLEYPANVSQGDDFLDSPGMTGLVKGQYAFQHVDMTNPDLLVSGVPYRTKLIFTPEHALAPQTNYIVNLPDFVDSGNVTYSGYVTFTFTTGTGSITELPASISTSIINTALDNTIANYFGEDNNVELQVVKTYPLDHSVQNNPNTLSGIVITFNTNIDPSSIDDNSVVINTVTATDHPAAHAVAAGNIQKTLSVFGNKITATFDILTSGETQLQPNNIVNVVLDPSIRSTTSGLLTNEFDLTFLTTTVPAYTDVLKVRLEAGGFLANVNDDAIQLGILEASLEADALTFAKSIAINDPFYMHARREWVTCRVAYMQLVNLSNNLLQSKSLDNLSVDYDTTTGIKAAINKALDCLNKWEGQLMAGGNLKTLTQPQGVVKGECDPNRPAYGRDWIETGYNWPNMYPAANTKVQYGRRSYKGYNPNLGWSIKKRWW